MSFDRIAQPSKLIRHLFILLMCYGLITYIFIVNAETYAKCWLGFYQIILSTCAPDLTLEKISVEDQKGQLMFVANFSTKENTVFKLQILPANTQTQTSTLVGNAIQVPIIIFTLIFAWPNLFVYRRLVAMCLAVPMILLITAIDIPWVLIGATWDGFYFYLEPEAIEHVWSIQVMNMLNNGGRLALALAGSLVCILTATTKKLKVL